MEYSIRMACMADTPELERIERGEWDAWTRPGPPPKKRIFGSIVSLDDVWVADQGGTPLGYVSIGTRTPFASNQHVVRLRSVVVTRNARRQGIGRALIRRAVEEARRRGARKLTLTVLHLNSPAIELYRQEGFREEGRLREEYFLNGDWVDDVFLSREIRVSAGFRSPQS